MLLVHVYRTKLENKNRNAWQSLACSVPGQANMSGSLKLEFNFGY